MIEFVENGKKYTASRGLFICRDVKSGNVEQKAFDVFVDAEPTKESVLQFADFLRKAFKALYE